MNKKTITAFILSALILGQGLVTNVQAQENSSNYIVKSSSIKDNGGFEYCEIDNFIESRMPDINEKFDVLPTGIGTYKYGYTAKANKVNINIAFNERALNFEVLLKNSSGRTIANKSFVDWEAPDGSKGVKKVHLRGNTKIGEYYTIEIINYDSVMIGGTINIRG
ncbi:hypothetical protein [Clostridium brassicae]|uniref:Uncharacterized protein n=1 Tax=Clostridium brassicae TaxID=2999072 RepID=A0ABT4D630_9CLOT|nr:hypothetical protein [Clostridium brassicae]MCY6957749.1 hypothetical protein [Clostridium brassicae]